MALRIVSGTVGGRLLKTPKGAELRPTQDRIKQAMFSSLGERVPGARVLDLYAGTGALGLEALSRGAASALFVERNKNCARCIAENVRTLGFTAPVVERDALEYLRQSPAPYDLIFADPPYEKEVGDATAHPLPALVRPWMAEGGAFVWEFFSGQSFEELPGWRSVFHRRYGETGVAILLPV